ncbi:hypothetical protein ACFFRE_07100 [Aciditerrimonas ferrireducens]|jgi:hypothetical protein|uniref:DksA C4-type domain-containing protein n=1 Tax=Aciditerrimonas ferrireducens TaxID=667306 RepID=A0ABV6C3M8_9ACTN
MAPDEEEAQDQDLAALGEAVDAVAEVLEGLERGTLWSCTVCGAERDPAEVAQDPWRRRCPAHGTELPAGAPLPPPAVPPSGSITT